MTRSILSWERAKPTEGTFWPWLVGIGVAAFLLRVAYLLTVAPPLPGVADESFYYYASDLIAQGHGYAQPFTAIFLGRYASTALHPPLWPALLAVVSLFTGPGSGIGSLTGVAADLHRCVGCLCGATVVVLVGLLGRRIGSWRVGLLAAGIAALFPDFIMLDGDLMSESLYGVLVGGLLLLGYRFTDRPTRRLAFMLGVLVGLAALTREEALWFIPVLVVPLAWKAEADRRWLTVLTLVGALVVIAPWTARNYAAFDHFVPVANSGAVIAGANNRCTYYGSHLGSWQVGCARVPHETPATPEYQLSSAETSQGLTYARRHAARAILVSAVRLLRVWSLYEPRYQAIAQPTVGDLGIAIWYVVLLAAGYGLVVLRRRGQRILILVAPAIVTSIAAILGDGLERLRYAAEIPLIAVAAWSCILIFDRARRAWLDSGHTVRGLLGATSITPPGPDR